MKPKPTPPKIATYYLQDSTGRILGQNTSRHIVDGWKKRYAQMQVDCGEVLQGDLETVCSTIERQMREGKST